MAEEKEPYEVITEAYRNLVRRAHPELVAVWPTLAGADMKYGSLSDGWAVYVLIHTGNPNMTSTSGIGRIPPAGYPALPISEANLGEVRDALRRFFRTTPEDAIILVPPSGDLPSRELEVALQDHEIAMGLAPMKIFLSHKSPDKGKVRDFKATLELLRFQPWLDEDAMSAGAELDRSILRGMKESCAAVFFLTPRFSDERYLADEINYARAEKRERPDRFAIVSLVFEEGGVTPAVPDLLRPYVWKTPRTDLEALREIVRALPIRVGEVRFQ